MIIGMVQSYALTIKQIASNWFILLMTRFPTLVVLHSSHHSGGSIGWPSGKENLACLLLDYNDQSLPVMQDEWIVSNMYHCDDLQFTTVKATAS